jgi:LAO/AO transport system kinase
MWLRLYNLRETKLFINFVINFRIIKATRCGKSRFLENMGKFLTIQGEKIAVLAVDPSSTTNGDKTEMPCAK